METDNRYNKPALESRHVLKEAIAVFTPALQVQE